MATIPTFVDGTAVHATSLNFLLAKPQSFTYQATPQAALANNTSTAVTWDTGGGAGSSVDTDPTSWSAGNPSRVVFNTPGTWLVGVTVLWAANATSQRQLDLRKNSGGGATAGTRVGIDIRQASAAGSTSNQVTQMLTGIVVGDYVEAFALQLSGGALAFISSNFIGACSLWAIWQSS
jgi:hypothetical protein